MKKMKDNKKALKTQELAEKLVNNKEMQGVVIIQSEFANGQHNIYTGVENVAPDLAIKMFFKVLESITEQVDMSDLISAYCLRYIEKHKENKIDDSNVF